MRNENYRRTTRRMEAPGREGGLKMPYMITKEGNISHTALPVLLKVQRAALILAAITAVVLILTW